MEILGYEVPDFGITAFVPGVGFLADVFDHPYLAVWELEGGFARTPAVPGVAIPAEQARKFDLNPKQVTAALVGLKGRAAVFMVQRFVADYEGEPLMAVLPGVALDELWDVVGIGERALLVLSGLVALVSVILAT